ncbi:MAG: Holliday junction resolvase RuvX [Patescibacteria group bacterium]
MEKVTKYLGIDWGEKRIGLATADSEVSLALPLRTVSTLAAVLSAVKEEEIDVIVLGAPKKMNGAAADNPLWQDFLVQLRERGGRPVELADERLTSQAADSLEGSEAEKAQRDEIAATLILQDYLDEH